MRLHHFYHIYAAGNWIEPVSEHIRALREYGLIDNLHTFNIGLVGSMEECMQVIIWLNKQGITHNIVATAETGWEQVTQIPMWEFSKMYDGLMLYAHTKGASDGNEVNIRWRRSMTWHNVCQWRYAVDRLQDHMTYGCHWIQPLVSGMPEHRQGNFMYAGTFFWAHCDLIRTWAPPPLNHRHEAEGYIGYGYSENPWPVWDCTPYFPNSDTFMDDWITDPNYNPHQRGKSYPPMQTVNAL